MRGSTRAPLPNGAPVTAPSSESPLALQHALSPSAATRVGSSSHEGRTLTLRGKNDAQPVRYFENLFAGVIRPVARSAYTHCGVSHCSFTSRTVKGKWITSPQPSDASRG